MRLYDNVSDTKALAGMLYGMNPKSVESYPAGATVSFGKGLFLNDGKVSNTKGDSGVLVGVALRHQCENGEYLEKDTVACINDGSVYVVLDADIEPTVGATAYVKADGKFTTSSSSTEAIGKFKSVAENGLALVDLSK